MDPPPEVMEAAARWEQLSQWERAELGRGLRREGWTYGEIMALIPVPKGTLAGWCREIRLTKEQVAAIKERTPSQKGVPKDTNWKRRAEIEQIRAWARSQAKYLINDPVWLAGAVLYWAEGSKTRNHLDLANTDPAALRLFIRWVHEYLDEGAEFALQIHLHEGNDEEAARGFWTDALGLSQPRFHRTFIKPQGTGHRKNRWTHGVCKVRFCKSADMWQRVMGWLEVVPGVLAPPFGNLEAGR